MSHTERRSFLAMATASLAASMSLPELLHGQVVGQLPPESLPQGDTGKRVNVMAIAAHPGDAFFAMGAPVAIATHYGGGGSLLSLSLGEKGSTAIPPAQYGPAQRLAAQKAAEKIGAKALFLDYRDGEVPVNNEISFAVCDLIRQYKPNVIVTHWKGSMHKDHRACYKVVDDAIFYAGVPGFTRKDPPHAVQRWFSAENWEDADGFIADTYLDVSPGFDKWNEACAEFPMWRGETGFRYNDYYNSLAIQRGCISNFTKAVALMSPVQRIRRVHTP
ncbi:MAG TPA: PIG-L family deacetylase [Edaphobacter sp.]|nr:PIG-L family deacetylase [Edaphobacter sp.]